MKLCHLSLLLTVVPASSLTYKPVTCNLQLSSEDVSLTNNSSSNALPGVLSFPLYSNNQQQQSSNQDDFQLEFSSSSSSSSALYKRSGRAVETSLFNNVAYYSIQVGLGTPTRFYKLAADTGSAQMWISIDSNLTTDPYDYVNDHSMNLTGEAGVIHYAQGGVQYLWAQTDVTIAGQTVAAAPFGIAYNSQNFGGLMDGVSGILGLGYPEKGKPNLPQQLKKQGFISRNVYSLSLTQTSSSDGSLLFGGVDHSKYTGTLYTLPRHNLPGKTRKYLAVPLTSISFGNEHGQDSQPDENENENENGHLLTMPVNTISPLDSGTTLSYLPPDIYAQVLSHFQADDSQSSAVGGPVFNLTQAGDRHISFDFQGAVIKVKGRDMINPSPNPLYDLYPYHPNSSMAVLGVQSNSLIANITLLGASFLKSAYVVYDLDGEEISLAQANLLPSTPQIQPISSNIPGAQQAPFYSIV